MTKRGQIYFTIYTKAPITALGIASDNRILRRETNSAQKALKEQKMFFDRKKAIEIN
jgi:hypothetical protein